MQIHQNSLFLTLDALVMVNLEVKVAEKNDESVPASFVNNKLGFSSVKIFKSLQLFFF